MAPKPQTFALLLVFLVSFVFIGSSAGFACQKPEAPVSYTEGPNPVGRFAPVDPKDPKVVLLAKFAIDEYNKGVATQISFNRVSRAAAAKSPAYCGTITYALVIVATDSASNSGYYDAILTVNNGKKKLVSMKKK